MLSAEQQRPTFGRGLAAAPGRCRVERQGRFGLALGGYAPSAPLQAPTHLAKMPPQLRRAMPASLPMASALRDCIQKASLANGGDLAMRYERLSDIVRLAIRLQGLRRGMTIADIQQEFDISRRTAERLRSAVEDAFGPLQTVQGEGRQLHWRLQSPNLRQLVRVSSDELAELNLAVESLRRSGLAERADALAALTVKLRAMSQPRSPEDVDTDLEALMNAEGLAMRAGPRPQLRGGVLPLLREAIKTNRVVALHYFGQASKKRSWQRVQPYGVLYGNRAFLVGMTAWAKGARLWRLANATELRLTDETFERDPNFDLRRYAKRSFGTFQERPVQVALRFSADVARDASAFLFHPDQKVTENEDGSLTVRFKAGGLGEMCWHLVTWQESVTVEQPLALRRRLADLCATLAAHHTQSKPAK